MYLILKIILFGYKNKDNEFIEKTVEESLRDKHLEFKKFQSYIFSKYKIDIPHFSKNLVEKANEISNINIIEDDIKKAISFIKECQYNAGKDNIECFIFSIDELENEICNVVKYTNNLMKND